MVSNTGVQVITGFFRGRGLTHVSDFECVECGLRVQGVVVDPGSFALSATKNLSRLKSVDCRAFVSLFQVQEIFFRMKKLYPENFPDEKTISGKFSDEI